MLGKSILFVCCWLAVAVTVIDCGLIYRKYTRTVPPRVKSHKKVTQVVEIFSTYNKPPPFGSSEQQINLFLRNDAPPYYPGQRRPTQPPRPATRTTAAPQRTTPESIFAKRSTTIRPNPFENENGFMNHYPSVTTTKINYPSPKPTITIREPLTTTPAAASDEERRKVNVPSVEVEEEIVTEEPVEEEEAETDPEEEVTEAPVEDEEEVTTEAEETETTTAHSKREHLTENPDAADDNEENDYDRKPDDEYADETYDDNGGEDYDEGRQRDQEEATEAPTTEAEAETTTSWSLWGSVNDPSTLLANSALLTRSSMTTNSWNQPRIGR